MYLSILPIGQPRRGVMEYQDEQQEWKATKFNEKIFNINARVCINKHKHSHVIVLTQRLKLVS